MLILKELKGKYIVKGGIMAKDISFEEKALLHLARLERLINEMNKRITMLEKKPNYYSVQNAPLRDPVGNIKITKR